MGLARINCKIKEEGEEVIAHHVFREWEKKNERKTIGVFEILRG